MSLPTVTQLTIAVTDITAMVRFYSAVLNITFKPFSFGDWNLFTANLNNVKMVLCPNELACVNASQSRIQLECQVPDIKEALEHAKHSGGTIKQDVQEDQDKLYASVIDPDGNTVVLSSSILQ